ncbi:hypothetical protein [Parvularcula dongshanensis]|uniref:WGR domain-containing protein n=1 Tax=Parvularcula dongshanensis TaxID=1173995 RepID=A0A840I3F1_9PROT|nr:hypothetical protein [Parvularcula dongshanensis]MBB4658734.1 hypothetical protein [Parvularcula dongshanensis]
MTADERQILLGIVERASQELSVEVPEVIAEVGPVYVRSTAATDVTPMLSFKPHPSMMPVRPEEIWMHDRGDGVRKETLFKLYNRRSEVIFYREGWFSDDLTIVEHWGTCGSRGEARSHTHTDKSNARKTYDRLKKVAYEAGFRAIPLSEHAKLVVEYPVAETKAETDLERRHALEDLLDELTGWLGLGHVDGSSIGSGTMEVLSYVVDFQTAKAAIVEALSETAFLDFNRIYRAAT